MPELFVSYASIDRPRTLQIVEAVREQGLDVWVVGGPGEKAIATEIASFGGPRVRDLTGTDLRNGIMAMALPVASG